MEFRIISLPPFKAASSGVDKNFDFSSKGVLGKFNIYFSAMNLPDREIIQAQGWAHMETFIPIKLKS